MSQCVCVGTRSRMFYFCMMFDHDNLPRAQNTALYFSRLRRPRQVPGKYADSVLPWRSLRSGGYLQACFPSLALSSRCSSFSATPRSGEPVPDRSLVTNLPKETMAFFSLPFREEFQSFTTHDQVLDYLCAYADEYKLHPIISLGCPVETVRRVTKGSPGVSRHPDDGRSSEAPSEEETTGAREQGDGSSERRKGAGSEAEEGTLGKWEVVYHRNSGPKASRVSEVFDAVCVCSGHFDEAFTPRAEGADQFRGKVMHAREYDRPGVEAFIGKRVLCVGSRSSGTDIAREVSSVGE